MRKTLAIIISLPLLLLGAEWQSLNGPPAGRADDMTIGYDPYIPAWVIYAADRTHKLYKSVNEGELWQPIEYEQITNPTCVITDKNNAQVVYIGKDDAIPVWKSTDGGQTWEAKSYGITNTKPRCFEMDPNNASVVYLGCGSGACAVFKTTDGGENWYEKPLPITPSNPVVNDLTIFSDPQRGTKILAGCTDGSERRGVWCSIDGGENWSRILDDNIYSVELVNMDVIYAGCDSGVYKSVDGGLYWTYLENSPQYQINDLAAITTNKVYAATLSGMFMTTDGGASWQEINQGICARMLLSLIALPSNPQTLFAGGEKGIYKTINSGKNWKKIVIGFRILNFKNISNKSKNLK